MERLNLSDAIDDLAPPPPPCFLNSHAWTQYLKSCATAQNATRYQKIVVMVDGKPRINHEFRFCKDCTPEHKRAMQDKKMCNPIHLKNLSL